MEKERLMFCIERFDHYYESVNNKSNILLGMSIFIIGGFITGYFGLNEKAFINNYLITIYLLILSLSLCCALILIFASTPFLSKETQSVYYFNAIAMNSTDGFKLKSGTLTKDEELDDLRSQTHSLARGLKKKFKRLRIVTLLITAQFILSIPLIILILCNLK